MDPFGRGEGRGEERVKKMNKEEEEEEEEERKGQIWSGTRCPPSRGGREEEVRDGG